MVGICEDRLKVDAAALDRRGSIEGSGQPLWWRLPRCDYTTWHCTPTAHQRFVHHTPLTETGEAERVVCVPPERFGGERLRCDALGSAGSAGWAMVPLLRIPRNLGTVHRAPAPLPQPTVGQQLQWINDTCVTAPISIQWRCHCAVCTVRRPFWTGSTSGWEDRKSRHRLLHQQPSQRESSRCVQVQC